MCQCHSAGFLEENAKHSMLASLRIKDVLNTEGVGVGVTQNGVRGGGWDSASGGWQGKGALEHRTLPPLPPPRGRQWAASGQDTFGFLEALSKYVHRYGMFVYCTRMLWHSKNTIKSLLNQSIFL